MASFKTYSDDRLIRLSHNRNVKVLYSCNIIIKLKIYLKFYPAHFLVGQLYSIISIMLVRDNEIQLEEVSRHTIGVMIQANLRVSSTELCADELSHSTVLARI